jgi:excinuclease ABC subunit C
VADPARYRPAPGSIPESPGVYRFRDEHRRVVYVGKAKNLRSRLNSYFADFAGLHPRTQSMLRAAAGVEWTVVATEVEALQLEYSWIKEFDPRFNVRYRDDKSYPYLAVTMDEEYPRVMVMRGAKRRGVRYFGPYSHAWAIRDTVDTLLRVFPVRTCSAGVFKRAGQIGRPCLLGYIGKCSAPCVDRTDAAAHRELAEEFCDFMAGQTGKFSRRLEAEMRRAAAAQEYERAARLRDDIQALQRALEKQAVVLGDGTDCDVIALAEDQLEAAVQVFYVRGGRVRGQRGWVVDKVEDITTGELVEQFLGQVYGDDKVAAGPAGSGAAEPGADDAQGSRGRGSQGGAGRDGASQSGASQSGANQSGASQSGASQSGASQSGASQSGASRGSASQSGASQSGASRGSASQSSASRGSASRGRPGGQGAIPREVLVPELPPDAAIVEDWLAARRGSRVRLRVPRRGDKKALLETVARNAAESLVQHKTKRASDLTTRSRAMSEIQEALELDDAPLRIECYDVSNLQGTHVVASMIVFEDGLPRKSEYRRFSINGLDGTDDVASIHEVICRRFRRYLEEREASGELDVLGDPAGELATPGPAAELAAVSGRPPKFAYPPNLVVIDGGPAQVAAATRALDELGIDDVAVCGLAKRLEEVWLPAADGPVILPRTSEGLYLLQRVRDEAHRFAITYHRKKRSAALTVSELDAIPGLGPARRATLLRHFGSVRRISGATVTEIAELPGIGPRIAEAILAALGPRPPGHEGAGHEGAGQDTASQDTASQDTASHDGADRDGAGEDGAGHGGAGHGGAGHGGAGHGGAGHGGAGQDDTGRERAGRGADPRAGSERDVQTTGGRVP